MRHATALQRRDVYCAFANGTRATDAAQCDRRGRPKLKRECENGKIGEGANKDFLENFSKFFQPTALRNGAPPCGATAANNAAMAEYRQGQNGKFHILPYN